MLALNQPGEDLDVTAEPLGRRGEQQGRDLRAVTLPVAVDPPVALLDADQAPRDVVVHQVVTMGVQVHPLRGDVPGDQHPDRRGLQLERFDDVLLIGVAEAAMQHGHLIVVELKIRLIAPASQLRVATRSANITIRRSPVRKPRSCPGSPSARRTSPTLRGAPCQSTRRGVARRCVLCRRPARPSSGEPLADRLGQRRR